MRRSEDDGGNCLCEYREGMENKWNDWKTKPTFCTLKTHTKEKIDKKWTLKQQHQAGKCSKSGRQAGRQTNKTKENILQSETTENRDKTEEKVTKSRWATTTTDRQRLMKDCCLCAAKGTTTREKKRPLYQWIYAADNSLATPKRSF